MVIISFTAESSIREIGYSFIPRAWSTATYSYAIQRLPQIWRSYFNSILITVVGTFLSTLMCALYSYALFRPDFTSSMLSNRSLMMRRSRSERCRASRWS